MQFSRAALTARLMGCAKKRHPIAGPPPRDLSGRIRPLRWWLNSRARACQVPRSECNSRSPLRRHISCRERRGVEQESARLPHKQEIAGASPASATVAEAANAARATSGFPPSARKSTCLRIHSSLPRAISSSHVTSRAAFPGDARSHTPLRDGSTPSAATCVVRTALSSRGARSLERAAVLQTAPGEFDPLAPYHFSGRSSVRQESSVRIRVVAGSSPAAQTNHPRAVASRTSRTSRTMRSTRSRVLPSPAKASGAQPARNRAKSASAIG